VREHSSHDSLNNTPPPPSEGRLSFRGKLIPLFIVDEHAGPHVFNPFSDQKENNPMMVYNLHSFPAPPLPDSVPPFIPPELPPFPEEDSSMAEITDSISVGSPQELDEIEKERERGDRGSIDGRLGHSDSLSLSSGERESTISPTELEMVVNPLQLRTSIVAGPTGLLVKRLQSSGNPRQSTVPGLDSVPEPADNQDSVSGEVIMYQPRVLGLTETVFASAQKEVLMLLTNNVLLSFTQSEEFQRHKENLENRAAAYGALGVSRRGTSPDRRGTATSIDPWKPKKSLTNDVLTRLPSDKLRNVA